MWEYKVIKTKARGFWGGKIEPHEVEAMMNGLGAQGWELVNAFDTSEGWGNTRDVVMVFKRGKWAGSRRPERTVGASGRAVFRAGGEIQTQRRHSLLIVLPRQLRLLGENSY